MRVRVELKCGVRPQWVSDAGFAFRGQRLEQRHTRRHRILPRARSRGRVCHRDLHARAVHYARVHAGRGRGCVRPATAMHNPTTRCWATHLHRPARSDVIGHEQHRCLLGVHLRAATPTCPHRTYARWRSARCSWRCFCWRWINSPRPRCAPSCGSVGEIKVGISLRGLRTCSR